MIKAILFDMNGVFISDSGPLSHKIEKRFHIPAEEIYPLIKSILHEVRKPGVESQPLWKPLLEKVGLTHDDFFQFWFEGEILNHELVEYVRSLREKGLKIIILSNNFPERTNYYRRLFPQLFINVDDQFFSWETGNVKPTPKAYTQILDKYPFKPAEYLYLDDNDDNLSAASDLGIISHKYLSLGDTKTFIEKYL